MHPYKNNISNKKYTNKQYTNNKIKEKIIKYSKKVLFIILTILVVNFFQWFVYNFFIIIVQNQVFGVL